MVSKHADIRRKYARRKAENEVSLELVATLLQTCDDAESVSERLLVQAALKSLTDVQTNTILRVNTRSGSILLVPCTVALNEAVSFQDGQINRVKASFNGNQRGTRYAS